MNEEMEIHKNLITGKTEIKMVCVYVERDSVCMGDDATAPHGEKRFFKNNDKLSDLLNELMHQYLKIIHNCAWEIIADNKILGYIKYDYNGNQMYELDIPDDLIVSLKIQSVYCKKIKEI